MLSVSKKSTVLKSAHKSIVLVVDVWNNNKIQFAIDTLVNNILTTVPLIPNIHTVALSSYSISYSKDLLLNNAYYINSANDFIKQNDSKSLKVNYIHTLKRNLDGNKTTHNKILSRKWDCHQTVILSTEQLNYYVEKHNIKNVIFVGTSLNLCIKDRPIGWMNVIQNSNLNLYTIQDCVLIDDKLVTHNSMFPNLSKDDKCYSVNEGIYQII